MSEGTDEMTGFSPDAPQDGPGGPADEGAPVPGAAPAPVPPRDRIAELEAELARLRSAALDGARAVLRVQPPHSSFTHGGITVHDSPTPVPQRALGALLTAAAEAGVTITEEG